MMWTSGVSSRMEKLSHCAVTPPGELILGKASTNRPRHLRSLSIIKAACALNTRCIYICLRFINDTIGMSDYIGVSHITSTGRMIDD
jgi:hypothetical protein